MRPSPCVCVFAGGVHVDVNEIEIDVLDQFCAFANIRKGAFSFELLTGICVWTNMFVYILHVGISVHHSLHLSFSLSLPMSFTLYSDR